MMLLLLQNSFSNSRMHDYCVNAEYKEAGLYELRTAAAVRVIMRMAALTVAL